jgi:hypothetical protein
MSQLKSIKCTKCAAPLDLLGGGRVKTITCSYCKSILDIENEYEVLGNFQNVKFDHEIPFKIGMQGELKGVHYTIIGRVRYSELHGDSFWDDLLLFSPLYGYAWLTYEEGHLTYSKRTRNFPNFSWNEVKNMDTLQYKERKYEADELFTARIDYIEGELTWVAKKYDKNDVLELYAPPYGISLEKSKHEIEYYELEYLDNREVFEAFNVPREERISHNSIHALREFGSSFFKPLMKMTLGVMLATALLIFMVLQTGKGDKILSATASNSSVLERPFSLTSSQYLSTLILTSPSDKALDNFNIKILEQNQTIFAINTHNCYISPRIKSTENLYLPTWSYRAKEVKVYLNLEANVSYVLEVTAVDATLASQLHVSIYEKEGRINYLVWYMMGLFLILIGYFVQKKVYQQQLDDEAYESWIFVLFKNSIPFLLLYLLIFFLIVPFEGMPLIVRVFLTLLVSVFAYNFIKIPINIVYSIYKNIKGE